MSESASNPPEGLIRLGVTPPLSRYVRQLWERREFAWASAVGELRAQHMDTALGNMWHLLNPILLIGVYYLVFGVILGVDRDVENFIAFLGIGVFVYHWGQKTITGGARTIVSNEGLIRSLQFPRALLPASIVVQEVIAFLPGVGVMVAIVLLMGEGITLSWFLVVPIFFLQLAFGTGAAFLSARAADRFRDVLNLLPYLFRLVFYASGILYPVEARFSNLFENPWVVRFFVANPFYAFVTLWREALMTTQQNARLPWLWLSAITWALIALIVGLLVFRAGEKEYGRG